MLRYASAVYCVPSCGLAAWLRGRWEISSLFKVINLEPPRNSQPNSRPGGPAEPERSGDSRRQISRWWSAAETPDTPPNDSAPGGREKGAGVFWCPSRGTSQIFWGGFRWLRSGLAPAPANLCRPSGPESAQAGVRALVQGRIPYGKTGCEDFHNFDSV